MQGLGWPICLRPTPSQHPLAGTRVRAPHPSHRMADWSGHQATELSKPENQRRTSKRAAIAS